MGNINVLWLSPYEMLSDELTELQKIYGHISIVHAPRIPRFYFEILKWSNENSCSVIAYYKLNNELLDQLVRHGPDNIDILRSERLLRPTGNRFYDSLAEEFIDEVIPVHLYWENITKRGD